MTKKVILHPFFKHLPPPEAVFSSPVLLESWRLLDVFCKSLEYYRKRCASGLLVLLLLMLLPLLNDGEGFFMV